MKFPHLNLHFYGFYESDPVHRPWIDDFHISVKFVVMCQAEANVYGFIITLTLSKNGTPKIH